LVFAVTRRTIVHASATQLRNPVPSRQARRSKRILIVEDDPEIAEMLRRTLNRSYSVFVARDGVEGLTLAKKARPDLLLLDVMLPGRDGFALAKAARSEPGLTSVPIVFLTARTTALDTIRGIQAGARHYIEKPFKLSNVVGKINRIFGKH
jgi:DNA-binding response OmpR family regulator